MKLFAVFLLALSLCLRASAASVKEIETQLGGRVGVFAFNTETQKSLAHRQTERFLMCSTFKLPLCTQVLSRVDNGEERLDRLLPFTQKDLLEWSPVTSKHAQGQGLSVERLCAATLQESDNTAANILLKATGGPEAVTQFLRSIGDKFTRLDRIEPTLNTIDGEKDTTTPEAIARTLHQILFGKVLEEKSRVRIEQWLRTITTGQKRFRAGVPAGWSVASKTGTGADGATNEIGVLYPPKGAPIVIAVLTTGSKGSADEREKALAEIARIVTRELAN